MSDLSSKSWDNTFQPFSPIVDDPVNCPRDIARMYIDMPRLTFHAKIFNVDSGEEAKQVVQAAYKQFIRFEKVEVVREDGEGWIVKMFFVPDDELSTSDTQILNEFQGYWFWRRHKSLSAEDRLSRIFQKCGNNKL